jgi:hypothetical protein
VNAGLFPSRKEPHNMDNDSDTSRFLQAVFGTDYTTLAIFADFDRHAVEPDPNMRHKRALDGLDLTLDCYWSIAAFPPKARTNRLENAPLNVRALVIDDVGTKGPPAGAVELALGEPTAIVETSPGNFQWSYRLAEPVAVAQWAGLFAEIERLVGMPLEGRDAVHLFRLPCGVNTKPGRDGFAVRLIKLNPEIELNVGKSGYFPTPAKSSPASPTPRVRDMLALARLLPNEASVSRQEWVERAHQFKALALDEAQGREAFELWSQKHASYDETKTAQLWDSLPDTLRTAGLEVLKEAEAADPERFAKLVNAEARAAFDDGEALPPAPAPEFKAKGITATPFKWRDAASFPLRDWLYGKLLIRKFISMTVAPGGVGKSSLAAAEALAQVTERNLLGDKPSKLLRVWIWNLEDPLEETERKIQTAALHYGISEADIGDRLFVDSGRQQKLVIARMAGREGAMIVRPVVEELVAEIKRRGVDIVVVDPFVSCHELPENDNTAQDMIVKEWGAVAERGNCAVHLLDHTRKAPSGTEVETESSRGAKAKTDAARVVRVINRMTDAAGKSYGIADPWQYFNTFHDKSNMAPPVNHRPWFHLESVSMGNGGAMAGVGAAQTAGESVGVVVQWTPPSARDVVTSENFRKAAKILGNKLWRADIRATNWWGSIVAPVLEIDDPKKRGLAQLNALVKAWINAGVAQEIEDFDEHRKLRKYIQIIGGF